MMNLLTLCPLIFYITRPSREFHFVSYMYIFINDVQVQTDPGVRHESDKNKSQCWELQPGGRELVWRENIYTSEYLEKVCIGQFHSRNVYHNR